LEDIVLNFLVGRSLFVMDSYPDGCDEFSSAWEEGIEHFQGCDDFRRFFEWEGAFVIIVMNFQVHGSDFGGNDVGGMILEDIVQVGGSFFQVL
jgi:hypothetical protein